MHRDRGRRNEPAIIAGRSPVSSQSKRPIPNDDLIRIALRGEVVPKIIILLGAPGNGAFRTAALICRRDWLRLGEQSAEARAAPCRRNRFRKGHSFSSPGLGNRKAMVTRVIFSPLSRLASKRTFCTGSVRVLTSSLVCALPLLRLLL